MAERPRILLVGPFPPTIGGVTTFLLNLMASPLAQEFDFIPFTTSRPPKRNVTENWGYGAIFRGGIGRLIAGAAITLWHLLSFPVTVVARRVDLVQVQASDFLVFWEAALYVLMARALGRPVLLRIGGSFDLFHARSSLRMQRLIARVLSLPDVLIAQSDMMRLYFARLGREHSVLVVPNWVEGSLLDARPERDVAPCRCLFIAGLEARHKGADEIIAAIRFLKQAGVAVRFHLLAVPPSLAAEIGSLDLADVVEIEGFVPHERVLAAMRRDHVFVLASHGEGFPNSLIEAMACGMAPIVTPVGAVPEIVGEDCALTVPVGDRTALADALERLAIDEGLRRRLSICSAKSVAARYVSGSALPPLAAVYRRLLESR